MPPVGGEEAGGEEAGGEELEAEEGRLLQLCGRGGGGGTGPLPGRPEGSGG